MICREQMDNPNDDGRYSVTGGQWCDCRQGECELNRVDWVERNRSRAEEQTWSGLDTYSGGLS